MCVEYRQFSNIAPKAENIPLKWLHQFSPRKRTREFSLHTLIRMHKQYMHMVHQGGCVYVACAIVQCSRRIFPTNFICHFERLKCFTLDGVAFYLVLYMLVRWCNGCETPHYQDFRASCGVYFTFIFWMYEFQFCVCVCVAVCVLFVHICRTIITTPECAVRYSSCACSLEGTTELFIYQIRELFHNFKLICITWFSLVLAVRCAFFLFFIIIEFLLGFFIRWVGVCLHMLTIPYSRIYTISPIYITWNVCELQLLVAITSHRLLYSSHWQ